MWICISFRHYNQDSKTQSLNSKWYTILYIMPSCKWQNWLVHVDCKFIRSKWARVFCLSENNSIIEISIQVLVFCLIWCTRHVVSIQPPTANPRWRPLHLVQCLWLLHRTWNCSQGTWMEKLGIWGLLLAVKPVLIIFIAPAIRLLPRNPRGIRVWSLRAARALSKLRNKGLNLKSNFLGFIF